MTARDEDYKDLGVQTNDLRRQADMIWRLASSGIETLRDVMVRSSQSGRLRVDVALLARERLELLAAIGEDLVKRAESGEGGLPASVRRTYERFKAVDAEMQGSEGLDRFHRSEVIFATSNEPKTIKRETKKRPARKGTVSHKD